MPQGLPTALFDEVVETIVPFMNTNQARETELLPFLQKAVYNQINWEGSPQEFTVHLVDLLSTEQLIDLLRRLPVGAEQKKNVAALCSKLKKRPVKNDHPRISNHGQDVNPFNGTKSSKPTFEISWLIFQIKQIEPVSFLIGLFFGVSAFFVIIISNKPPILVESLIGPAVSAAVTASAQEKASPQLKITEVGGGALNKEGEHYQLKSNFVYIIEVRDSKSGTEYRWSVLPEKGFLNIPLTTDSKIELKASPDKIGSGGIVFVCVREPDGACQNFTEQRINIKIIDN